MMVLKPAMRSSSLSSPSLYGMEEDSTLKCLAASELTFTNVPTIGIIVLTAPSLIDLNAN